MGNSLTSSIWCSDTNRRDHIRNQVSKLGDTYPFGDKELIQLARCHAYLEFHNDKRQSFLSAWAMYCFSLPSPDWASHSYGDILQVESSQLSNKKTSWQIHRESILLNTIEAKILPSGFGETLENVLFRSSSTKKNEYEEKSNGRIMPKDANAAMMRLEKFLEGASNCSRRGGRQSLTCLFQCCSVPRRNSNNAVEQMAMAKDLLQLAYRISLATAYLIMASEQSSDDETSLLPQDMGEDMLTSSLLAHAHNTHNNGSGASLFETTSTQNGYHSASHNHKSEAPLLSEKEQTQMVTLQQFIEWSEQYAICLSSCLPTFFHYIFFPNVPYPPSRTPLLYPDLKDVHSAFFPSRNSPRLFALGSMSPSLGGEWHRLFTSDDDGMSFNRLQNALLGYSGPTLILIREIARDGIFGAFTASPWKESKDFYGNSDCFLFRLTPSVAIYRPRGTGSNFMYCNSKARSKGYDGQAHGIGFGGTVDQPRLFISETFEGCVAATGDMTFTAGALLPPPPPDTPSTKFFDIQSIEVWGVGGSEVVQEALGSRNRQREIAAANIQKARKVDKAQFLDDFNSGLIFSKAFAHKQQVAGRVDVCVSDDENDNDTGKK